MTLIGTLGNALLAEQCSIWNPEHHWRMNGSVARIAGNDWLRKGREKDMIKAMKRIPHMCITCKNYEPYHCLLDDSYIGYLNCAERTKCRQWKLSDDYKKGGKFYDDVLKEGEMG